MSTVKVNSFVNKFLALWADGENVQLKLLAENGTAKVTIEVDLGLYEAPQKCVHKDDKYEVYGNSRQRRRDRRAQNSEECKVLTKKMMSLKIL